MAVVTLTPPCNTKLSETLSLNTNNKSLNDASFSSFFNKAGQESFVRKLADSNEDIGPVSSKQDDHKSRFGIASKEVGELGVFGAEKYFTGVMDHERSTPRVAKPSNARKLQCQRENGEEIVHLDRIVIPSKMKQPGTPSVRSESSWNSQSVLLNNFTKNPFRKKNKKVHGKSLLAILGCKCSCYDKNSVAVQDQVGEISFSTTVRARDRGLAQSPKAYTTDASLIKKTQSDSWLGNGNMQNQIIDRNVAGYEAEEQVVELPASNSNDPEKDILFGSHSEKDDEGKQLRKSLEVFGSPVYEKRSKSLALDPKRLPRLSWDAKANVKPELEISGEVCSDSESDASSDLFELDSITNPILRRQASNAKPDSVTSTTSHAPSEASNEWSVATASANTSNYEIQGTMSVTNPATHKTFSTIPHAKEDESKDIQWKEGTSMFLGCNNDKAVKVAGCRNEFPTRGFNNRS